jgi:hypothetical protein
MDDDSFIDKKKRIAKEKLNSLLEDSDGPLTVDDTSESDLSKALPESMFSSELSDFKAIEDNGLGNTGYVAMTEPSHNEEKLGSVQIPQADEIQPVTKDGLAEAMAKTAKDIDAGSINELAQREGFDGVEFIEEQIGPKANGVRIYVKEKNGASEAPSENNIKADSDGKDDLADKHAGKLFKPGDTQKFYAQKLRHGYSRLKTFGISALAGTLLLTSFYAGRFCTRQGAQTEHSRAKAEYAEKYTGLMNRYLANSILETAELNGLRQELSKDRVLTDTIGTTIDILVNNNTELEKSRQSLDAAKEAKNSIRLDTIEYTPIKGECLSTILKQQMNLGTYKDIEGQISRMYELNSDAPELREHGGNLIFEGKKYVIGLKEVKDECAPEKINGLQYAIAQMERSRADLQKQLSGWLGDEIGIVSARGKTQAGDSRSARAYVAEDSSKNSAASSLSYAAAANAVAAGNTGEEAADEQAYKTVQEAKPAADYAARQGQASMGTGKKPVEENVVGMTDYNSKTSKHSVAQAESPSSGNEKYAKSIDELISETNKALEEFTSVLDYANRQTPQDKEYTASMSSEVSAMRAYLIDLLKVRATEKSADAGILGMLDNYMQEQKQESRKTMEKEISDAAKYINMVRSDLSSVEWENSDYLKKIEMEKQASLEGLLKLQISDKENMLSNLKYEISNAQKMKSEADESISYLEDISKDPVYNNTLNMIEFDLENARNQATEASDLLKDYGESQKVLKESIKKYRNMLKEYIAPQNSTNSGSAAGIKQDKLQPDKTSYNLLNGKSGLEQRYFKASEADDILSVMASLFPIYAELLGNSAGKA